MCRDTAGAAAHGRAAACLFDDLVHCDAAAADDDGRSVLLRVPGWHHVAVNFADVGRAGAEILPVLAQYLPLLEPIND